MSGKTDRDDQSWLRTIARVKPGTAIGALQAKLNANSHAFEQQRAKHFVGMSNIQTARFLAETVTLEPAAAGASNLQGDYQRSLLSLGVLVVLVLLIACANIANLMPPRHRRGQEKWPCAFQSAPGEPGWCNW